MRKFFPRIGEASKVLARGGVLIILFSIFYILFSNSASAANNASLYLAPSTGTYTVGNTFSIEVKVNTGGVAINAADGTIVFNPDKLEVVGVSKTNSIFSLWVQDPSFSNSLGTVTFAGGRPTPGYTGAAGGIITITFKAKTATYSTANVTFAGGSVLADDGKGTNVLSNMGSGVYILVTREITPITPGDQGDDTSLNTPEGTPGKPVVSSATHSDQNKWYSNNNPEFTWQLPSDITGVSLLLHQKSDANPGSNSDGLLTSQKYENIENGVWYFHIRFKNESGWGEILHRKVLIDTDSPKNFEITVDDRGISDNPKPVIYFETQDSVSGMDYYEVSANGEKSSTTSASTKNSPYQLSFMLPAGKNIIEVMALDKAGNYSKASTEFEISCTESMKITKIPISVMLGEVLMIEGTADPFAVISIYIQKTDKEPVIEKVNADSEGKFVLKYEKVLAKGDYVIWAKSESEEGGLVCPTKNYSMEVGLPPFLKIGKMVLDYANTMVTLIVLIAVSIGVIVYTWYRVSLWRKRISKETKEVSQTVNAAFRALREEVEEQVSMLDKKPGLTKEEKATRDKLHQALDISEKFIGKEIKDIEKELE